MFRQLHDRTTHKSLRNQVVWMVTDAEAVGQPAGTLFELRIRKVQAVEGVRRFKLRYGGFLVLFNPFSTIQRAVGVNVVGVFQSDRMEQQPSGIPLLKSARFSQRSAFFDGIQANLLIFQP
uniref:Uncharacterized protein n=1 Tax=Anopheles atroparvus TaxID=41427 RepID=A0A182J8X1_ANOAO